MFGVFWSLSGSFWIDFRSFLGQMFKFSQFQLNNFWMDWAQKWPKNILIVVKTLPKILTVTQERFLALFSWFLDEFCDLKCSSTTLNALDSSQKYLAEIGKTRIFHLKMTQIRPKNTLKVSKTPANMFLEVRTHFFLKRFQTNFWPRNAQKCPKSIRKIFSWNWENSNFWPKNDPKSTQKHLESDQNTPQARFLMFVHVFWHIFKWFFGPETPKNAPNPSKNFLAKIEKTRIFDPKLTKKHHERGQNTSENVTGGSRTLFGTFLDEIWTQKCLEMPQNHLNAKIIDFRLFWTYFGPDFSDFWTSGFILAKNRWSQSIPRPRKPYWFFLVHATVRGIEKKNPFFQTFHIFHYIFS